MDCGCGTGLEAGRFNGTGGYYLRSSPNARRDTCCPLCASGLVEYVAPAAGYYLPAGGDAASDAAAAAAARLREAQAAREAADRAAALAALERGLGTANTGISEGFATERIRLETEARTAQARAEAASATERARIEAARDLELARIRGANPLIDLRPIETPSTMAPRTDSGASADSFPMKAALVVGAVGVALYAFSRSSGGSRRRKRR